MCILSEFDVRTGTWSPYVNRLNMYFKVYKKDTMLPILIASMGDEAYELLENLAGRKKPSELTFEGANKLLRNYLQPTSSALVERYRFRQRRQQVKIRCQQSIQY